MRRGALCNAPRAMLRRTWTCAPVCPYSREGGNPTVVVIYEGEVPPEPYTEKIRARRALAEDLVARADPSSGEHFPEVSNLISPLFRRRIPCATGLGIGVLWRMGMPSAHVREFN